MVSFKFLAVSSVVSVALAHPQPTPAAHLEERTDCAKINGALTILKKLGPPATSFCSSYLKVPMTKTLTTTTTSVVTSTASTTTVTVTSSVCPAAANPVRRAVPSGKPFKVYWDGTKTNVVENVEKRTEKVLPLLAAFAAAKISDGCNCLGIQPKATTTKTIAAATSTVNVVATSTVCVPSCIADGATCQSGGNACCNSASICNLGTGLQTGTCGPPPPPAPVCSPPGGSCTIDNFISACCKGPDGSVGCYFPGGDPYDGICFQ